MYPQWKNIQFPRLNLGYDMFAVSLGLKFDDCEDFPEFFLNDEAKLIISSYRLKN